MLTCRRIAMMSLALICGGYACGDDDSEATQEENLGATATVDGGTVDTGAVADSAAAPNAGGIANLAPLPLDVALPIVFVHGFAGSASQYQSQAARFVANGYAPERIKAFDHDGAGVDFPGFVAGADAVIEAARQEFKVDKVYLVGHSRGTFVSSTYLGDATRAAKVAKYISLDGSGCGAAMTAGVPCLAPSQMNLPGQKHVEVATSAESFARQFEFLIGRAPEVVNIVKQAAPVEISGRAVNFPANTGRTGATLQIWEINSQTGARVGSEPKAKFSIGEDGNWGPAVVSPDKHYELELAGDASTQHFYPQRFLRSSACSRDLRIRPRA